MLGVVSSALPIGGLPSFLLIGAGWWAVEKGARKLIGMFSDDPVAAPPPRSRSSAPKKKKKNQPYKPKYKARL